LLNVDLTNTGIVFIKKNIFAFCCCLLLASCQNDDGIREEFVDKVAEIPVEISKNVELLYSDSAKVKARMTTPLLYQYKKPVKDEMPEGVKVEFFNAVTLEVESYLTSKKAVRDIEKGEIEVTDSVVVNNSKGETLTTEQLIWDEHKRIIFTDKYVKITTPDKIIEGYGLTADENLNNYQIKKMSGVVYMSK